MRKAVIPLTILCLCLLPWGTPSRADGVDFSSYAQMHSADDPKTDTRLIGFLESSFLTVTCDVPVIQPKLANLERGVETDTEDLIRTFFGSRDAVMSEEGVISPLWGPGRRYKSGMVIYLAENEDFGMRNIEQAVRDVEQGKGKELEIVPAYLDVYPNGFVYANNIPHKPVYAADVKAIDELKPNMNYRLVFSEEEGQEAAETLIAEMFGELKVPDGSFQSAVQAMVRLDGERLFAYRAHPQYLTTYEVALDGGAAQTFEVAVPVLDVYLHLQLDADRVLAGMEYFWTDEIRVAGAPRECIQAAEALIIAREELLEHFGGEPPLLNVSKISLGYVQNRRDRAMLIPAWIFDAWYTQTVATEQNQAGFVAREPVRVPMMFAVDALTGEPFAL
ncbi:hypothetical protein IIA79_03945 [bacterium]|nr:hypothetical protein [bacterium]